MRSPSRTAGESPEERWERLLRLLEPVHGPAWRTARHLCRSAADADDLYQDAVLRAFEKLPALRDEARFRSWFFAVLLSIHRSRARRGFWKRFLSLEWSLAEGPEPVGEDGRIVEKRRRQAERASRALAQLPAVQREAVVLHEIEGYKLEEIAVLQGVTLSAVKSRVSRGRLRLRRRYEQEARAERAADEGESARRTATGTEPAAVWPIRRAGGEGDTA